MPDVSGLRDYRQRMFIKDAAVKMGLFGRDFERVMGRAFDASAVAYIMDWEAPAPAGAKSKKKDG